MTILAIVGMLVLDLLIASIFSGDFSWQFINFIPMLSLLFVLFISIDQPYNKFITHAFLIGLAVDLINHSLLFTHAILYVVVLLVMQEYQRHFSTSLIEIVIMGIVAIFLKETLLYSWYAIANVVDISIISWYTSRLLITLIGNIPLIFIAYYASLQHLKYVEKSIRKQQQSESTLWGFLKD